MKGDDAGVPEEWSHGDLEAWALGTRHQDYTMS